MAMMVFGTMAFVMTLFYFVNWPDADIQHATWCALSDMIAIFCAVLAFSAFSFALHDFAETDAHAHGPPTFTAICVHFARYIFFMATLEGIFHAFKKNPWSFKYSATILGHVTGFATIEFFGSLLQFNIFKDSLVLAWLGVIVFSGVIAVVAHSINIFTVGRATGSHHWKEESTETCSEYVALAAGLLFSLVIRMSVSGALPPVHGAPRNKSDAEVWALLIVALLLIPAVLGISAWKYNLSYQISAEEEARIEAEDAAEAEGEEAAVRVKAEGDAARVKADMMMRIAETTQMTICFVMGWTLLYWGYWKFYATAGDKDEDFGPGGKMLQRLTMAGVNSFIVFGTILVIDKIADRLAHKPDIDYAFRSLLKTCSLLMGLSWESTFNQGVHAISGKYHGSTQTLVVIGLSAITCAVVLPAWAWYILPNSIVDNGEHFEKDFLAEHHEHGHHEEEGGIKGRSATVRAIQKKGAAKH
jgi:hypothetical protein